MSISYLSYKETLVEIVLKEHSSRSLYIIFSIKNGGKVKCKWKHYIKSY